MYFEKSKTKNSYFAEPHIYSSIKKCYFWSLLSKSGEKLDSYITLISKSAEKAYSLLEDLLLTLTANIVNYLIFKMVYFEFGESCPHVL